MKKKPLFFLIAACALMALCGTSFAEIYKWTDKNGKTHYTDNPELIPSGSNSGTVGSGQGTANFISGPETPKGSSSSSSSSTNYGGGRLDGSWQTGKYGLQHALESNRKHGRAVIIYFYTDWCTFCKKLESTVLTSYNVIKALNNVEKVRINPENGSEEMKLAINYGVAAYPTLFIVPAKGKGQLRRVNTHWDEPVFILDIESSK